MPQEEKNQTVLLPEVVSIKMLATQLGVAPVEIIKKLMESGILVNINESVDFDTAAIIASEFQFDAIKSDEEESRTEEKDDKSKIKKKVRPPVVTIMGHVDHGKTKLLDAIRETNIIGTESGGITQHIGAYQTKVKFEEENGKKSQRAITFLDTPGHEAFSQMRAQGANITDIVIIVVAADEGVKPQTLEAISHAKAAKVPIIVAINKIDKPDSDIDRVKRQLTEHMLVPEEWGGKTPMIGVSAKTKEGIDKLLELIVLTADVEELEARSDGNAKAVVVESKIQSGKGAVATSIIQEGILKPGDVIIYDDDFAKVRFLEDWKGQRIKQALPSDPVMIAGFKKIPKTGGIIFALKDEKTAKARLEERRKKDTVKGIGAVRSLADVSKSTKEGEKITELKIILRADVKGSLDAITDALEKFSQSDIKVTAVSSALGAITESDINLAIASGAIVVAFRVPIPANVLKLSEANDIKISRYEIIYELIDDISAALEGLLEPEIIETTIGKLEVIKVFFKSKGKTIVGGKVIEGKITPGTKVLVYRGEEKIGELKTELVQIGGERVNVVEKGNECGVSCLGELKLKAKDILEFVLVEEKIRSIKKITQ
ncbi:MAG: Translation initiation factor IF-2 [candidate division WS2 bacterium ADurb.Bin280]|uniref:Translation initiation factor IF-2 n=1 Tax=candidate division WS2 bacterium ADurb.Bin280 TaxID=1852829 RepID=A0A1V5SFH4_9BACT|nr:MAG: Translation initiation factor IF-2 [candidate division WS2 bacterium ADurb.Bin280]